VWDDDYVPKFDPARDPASFERVYTVGTLVLDVTGAASRTVLWRASADTDIDLRAKSKERDKVVREAVQLMFAEFPAAK
jgi:hypothetical protein